MAEITKNNNAAHRKQEHRPWLKERYLASSGNEEVRPKLKLQSPAAMRKKKKQDSKERTLYHEVMEEVANKTLEAFLKHYGDDSVHVQFQQIWKSKMTNKKVKLGHLIGNIPPASVTTGVNRTEERGSGSFSKEKDPLLAPLRTTTWIPSQGQSIEFQCFPADQDDNGRFGSSSVISQQPSRPWLKPADSQVPKPRKFQLRNPAKKQQLHQPWLQQTESGGSNHQQDEERDSIFECFLHQMLN